MREEGWRIPEDSFFYDLSWYSMNLTVIRLRDEMDELPDWGTNLEVERDSEYRKEILNIPISLTCGKEDEITFKLLDGREVTCYINNIYLVDVWKDTKNMFEDEEYRRKALKYLTIDEFEKIKEGFKESLEKICPKGKCYMYIEYEVTEDLQLNFYSSSFLDSKPEVRDSSSSIGFRKKPERTVGKHGLRLRGAIIQEPFEPDTVTFEGELFACIERIEMKPVKLY